MMYHNNVRSKICLSNLDDCAIFERSWQKSANQWENYLAKRASLNQVIESLEFCIKSLKEYPIAEQYGQLILSELIKNENTSRHHIDWITDMFVRWRNAILNVPEHVALSLYEEDVRIGKVLKKQPDNRPTYQEHPFQVKTVYALLIQHCEQIEQLLLQVLVDGHGGDRKERFETLWNALMQVAAVVCWSEKNVPTKMLGSAVKNIVSADSLDVADVKKSIWMIVRFVQYFKGLLEQRYSGAFVWIDDRAFFNQKVATFKVQGSGDKTMNKIVQIIERIAQIGAHVQTATKAFEKVQNHKEVKHSSSVSGSLENQKKSIEIDSDPVWSAFLLEAPSFAKGLRELVQQMPKGKNIDGNLLRHAHSLRSLGATAQVTCLERLASNLESWMNPYYDSQVAFPESHWQYVVKTAAQIEQAVQCFVVDRNSRFEPDYTSSEWLVLQDFSAPTEGVEGTLNDSVLESMGLENLFEISSDLSADAGLVESSINEVIGPSGSDEEEFDFDIVPGFINEANELMLLLEHELRTFKVGKSNFVAMNRHLHTLKGGARMACAKKMGDLLHTLEDQTLAEHLSVEQTEQVLQLVRQSIDSVYEQINQLQMALVHHQNKEIESQSSSKEQEDGQMGRITERIQVETQALNHIEALIVEGSQLHQQVSRHIESGLDEMVGMAPITIRLENIASNIMIEAETKIASSAQRSTQFDALEFDSFSALHEYTRRLQEAVNDIEVVSDHVQEHLIKAQDVMRSVGYLDSDMSGRVRELSRAPFVQLEGRLRALVRQTAFELNKNAVLLIRGGRVTFERSTLEKLIPILEHLLRNALAHGIETPEERKSKGKDEDGKIVIQVSLDGNHLQVQVSDDGAGVNTEYVFKKAKEKGLLKDGASEREILGALFAPGFSTAETVSQIAGRGVGLDVVADALGQLGGRVTMDHIRGKGCTFTLRIPQSTSIMTGVMLSVSGAPYIVPAGLIKQMALVDAKLFDEALVKNNTIHIDGHEYEPYWFGSLIKKAKEKQLNKSLYQQVVILHDSPFAFAAERFEYVSGVALKAFKQGVYASEGLIGYTLLPTGAVAIALNPQRLSRTNVSKALPVLSAETVKDPLILVVDDSVTIRSVTQKLLKKNGYRVETAENGSVALLKVSQERPDIILMDIEMPVMDGFEATVALKSDVKTQDIPIFMISSRNAQKHLDHARSIGANEFFGKPYDKEELLKYIEQYLSK